MVHAEPVAPARPRAYEDDDAPDNQGDPRQLDEVGADAAVLTEPQVLVEASFDSPEHHPRTEHDARRVARARRTVGPAIQPSLDGQEDQVHGEVLHGLEDRDGQAPARLAGVVHAEPLVGGMATPGHHQLRPEQPAHGPAGHEHRRGEIEGAAECQLGAPPAGEDDAGGHGEEKPPERRQPAVPDGEDVARVVGVVAEVGQDVEGPGAHDGGEDDPEEDGQEPVGRVAVLAQPALEVGVAEPERQREPDAVGVDLQRSDVEVDGDGFHGTPAARLVSGAALAAA